MPLTLPPFHADTFTILPPYHATRLPRCHLRLSFTLRFAAMLRCQYASSASAITSLLRYYAAKDMRCYEARKMLCCQLAPYAADDALRLDALQRYARAEGAIRHATLMFCEEECSYARDRLQHARRPPCRFILALSFYALRRVYASLFATEPPCRLLCLHMLL